MAIFATHGCFTGVAHVVLLVIKIKFVRNIFPTLTWFSVQENTGVQGRGLEIRNSERRRNAFLQKINSVISVKMELGGGKAKSLLM